MSFWSGEKLAQRLPSLIQTFKQNNLDCASYRLCIGEQVFATSDRFATGAPASPLVSILSTPPNNTLRIKPGQFAFLMTEEVIQVPDDAIALISMRAAYKFKGLINVSGFHVDPGWDGKLLFSVYNAGPGEIIVERGDPAFLIVYADLDCKSQSLYSGSSKGQSTIKAPLLQNMTEQVFSPLMLQRRIEDLVEKVADVEKTAAMWKVITLAVSTMAGILIGMVALFATFAPSTLGVIMAKTIENGGYEMRQKIIDPPQISNNTIGLDRQPTKKTSKKDSPQQEKVTSHNFSPLPPPETSSPKGSNPTQEMNVKRLDALK